MGSFVGSAILKKGRGQEWAGAVSSALSSFSCLLPDFYPLRLEFVKGLPTEEALGRKDKCSGPKSALGPQGCLLET